MMKTAPSSAFVVTQAEFLLQFLIIALNNPALFGDSHQIPEFGLGRQCGNPVFRRPGFLFRPFETQPLFRMWFGLPVVTMCRTDSECGKAGAKFVTCALSPCDGLPRFWWQ